RERGITVVETPLRTLAARITAEAPRVLVVDVDQTGAVEAIERVRDTSAAELLCIGDTLRAAELGAQRSDGRSFARPLDLEALVLAALPSAEPGPPPSPRATPPGGTTPPPPASATQGTAPPPRRADSEAPPASEHGNASDPLEIAAILPVLDEGE